jgi:hypothetical protein
MVNAGLSGNAKFKNTVLIPGVFNTKAASGVVIFKVSSVSQEVNIIVTAKNRKPILFIIDFICLKLLS